MAKQIMRVSQKLLSTNVQPIQYTRDEKSTILNKINELATSRHFVYEYINGPSITNLETNIQVKQRGGATPTPENSQRIVDYLNENFGSRDTIINYPHLQEPTPATINYTWSVNTTRDIADTRSILFTGKSDYTYLAIDDKLQNLLDEGWDILGVDADICYFQKEA